jgi:hypothetical protein
MKLKAVFEIQGLSNVLTGTRKAEGIANPGDLYEVDANTAKKHLAEGYGVDPSEAVADNQFERGPSIIEGELVSDTAPTLADIAPKIGGSEPAPKKATKKKAAATAVESAAPVEGAAEGAAEEESSDEDDLGLDDGSDAVE